MFTWTVKRISSRLFKLFNADDKFVGDFNSLGNAKDYAHSQGFAAVLYG
jgi:hypothetical protein